MRREYLQLQNTPKHYKKNFFSTLTQQPDCVHPIYVRWRHLKVKQRIHSKPFKPLEIIILTLSDEWNCLFRSRAPSTALKSEKKRVSVQLCNYKHVGVCKFFRGNPFIEPPRRSAPSTDSNFAKTSRNKSSISHTNSLWWRRNWDEAKKSPVSPTKVIKVCCAQLRLQQQVCEIKTGFLIAKFSIYCRKKKERREGGKEGAPKFFTPSRKTSEKREGERESCRS